MENQEIMQEFQKRLPIYEQAAIRFKTLLEEILKQNEIDYHLIECRAKDASSFERKIGLKQYKNPFEEMTDFVGVRIILYYINDVDKVGDILSKQFVIDKDNSVSKKKLLKSNEFGYTSDHFIASLDDERKSLLEWKLFRKTKVEIQVRTVLQHAWASISHLIDYKTDEEDSSIDKRKLFRLAGLIELADEEFQGLRSSKIMRQITQNLKSSESLNNFTLHRYLTYGKTETIKKIISTSAEHQILDKEFKSGEYAKEVFIHCKSNGINSIQDLDKYLSNFLDQNPDVLPAIFVKNNKTWTGSLPFIIIVLLIAGNYKELDPYDLVDLGWDFDLAERIIESLSAFSRRPSSFA